MKKLDNEEIRFSLKEWRDREICQDFISPKIKKLQYEINEKFLKNINKWPMEMYSGSE